MPARRGAAGHAGRPGGDEILVTTIHRTKGREWDVVVVGSLDGPDLETDRVVRNLSEYCDIHRGGPAERIGEADRARWHNVAFTRARQRFGVEGTAPRQAVDINHLERLVVRLM